MGIAASGSRSRFARGVHWRAPEAARYVSACVAASDRFADGSLSRSAPRSVSSVRNADAATLARGDLLVGRIDPAGCRWTRGGLASRVENRVMEARMNWPVGGARSLNGLPAWLLILATAVFIAACKEDRAKSELDECIEIKRKAILAARSDSTPEEARAQARLLCEGGGKAEPARVENEARLAAIVKEIDATQAEVVRLQREKDQRAEALAAATTDEQRAAAQAALDHTQRQLDKKTAELAELKSNAQTAAGDGGKMTPAGTAGKLKCDPNDPLCGID
jgi:hypothetical protein